MEDHDAWQVIEDAATENIRLFGIEKEELTQAKDLLHREMRAKVKPLEKEIGEIDAKLRNINLNRALNKIGMNRPTSGDSPSMLSSRRKELIARKDKIVKEYNNDCQPINTRIREINSELIKLGDTIRNNIEPEQSSNNYYNY